MIREATLKMLSDLQRAGLKATFSYAGVQRNGKVERLTETNVTIALDDEEGSITSRQRPQKTMFKTFKLEGIENLVW